MLSIIVCTFNRAEYIGENLRHLKQQKCNTSLFEVIIVNNNSTDNTEQICKQFIQDEKPTNFHYFLELNQGHSFARNRGIQEAKGKYIAFIDDDAMVDHHYTTAILDFFSEHQQVMAIGGKIIPVYEEEDPKWMSKYLLPLVAAIDLGNRVKPFEGLKFPIGANMAFRSQVFDEFGLFNTRLGRKGSGLEGGDEKDVFHRLKKENQPIYYLPSAVVRHIIPQKRLEIPYIKGLAIGVGTSEKKRLEKATYFREAG